MRLGMSGDKSGLLVVQGMILEMTVSVCMDTLESESSSPDTRHSRLSLFTALLLTATSFSRDRASTLRTQSPADMFSLMESMGLGRDLPRITGDLPAASEDLDILLRGDSGSGLDRDSFSEL